MRTRKPQGFGKLVKRTFPGENGAVSQRAPVGNGSIVCILYVCRTPSSEKPNSPINSQKEKDLAQDEKTWTSPQAMAIPKEGYFEFQQGKYGAIYPKTPACYGFTIIAKIKTGREEKTAFA
jgi:hypothetical protein